MLRRWTRHPRRVSSAAARSRLRFSPTTRSSSGPKRRRSRCRCTIVIAEIASTATATTTTMTAMVAADMEPSWFGCVPSRLPQENSLKPGTREGGAARQFHHGEEEVVDLADHVHEALEVHRLAHVGVGVQGVAAQDVLFRL